jgi:hypothetical protein
MEIKNLNTVAQAAKQQQEKILHDARQAAIRAQHRGYALQRSRGVPEDDRVKLPTGFTRLGLEELQFLGLSYAAVAQECEDANKADAVAKAEADAKAARQADAERTKQLAPVVSALSSKLDRQAAQREAVKAYRELLLSTRRILKDRGVAEDKLPRTATSLERLPTEKLECLMAELRALTAPPAKPKRVRAPRKPKATKSPAEQPVAAE